MLKKLSEVVVLVGAGMCLAVVFPLIWLWGTLAKKAAGFRISNDSHAAYLLAPMVKWEGSYQRPHHLAVHLAKEHKVLYFSPMPLHHVSGKWRSWWKNRNLHPVSGLTVWQPLIFPGERRGGFLRKLNEPLILAWLRIALPGLQGSYPAKDEAGEVIYKKQPLVVYTNDPLWESLAGKLKEQCLVYDVIDDFAAFSWARKDAKERERGLIAKADVVFTGTYSLYLDRKDLHPEITYVPCGVDFGHFHQAALALPEPPEAASWKGPVLGYFGFLNERLDTDLIEALCQSHPEWQVVLIGPIQRNFGLSQFLSQVAMVAMSPEDPAFGLKRTYANLHILGRREYRDLPKYLRRFDVCLLPYLLDEATRAIHPVKVLEYLAAGKPVVSTAIPDVQRFYRGTVEVATSHEAFIAACKQLLASPGDSGPRLEQARKRSWEAMAQEMLAGIGRKMEKAREKATGNS